VFLTAVIDQSEFAQLQEPRALAIFLKPFDLLMLAYQTKQHYGDGGCVYE